MSPLPEPPIFEHALEVLFDKNLREEKKQKQNLQSHKTCET